VENVVSGERYKHITDEVIKYVLGYYGKPAAPIDPKVMERIMGLPRTKDFLDWKPEGYDKPIEEFRQELGQELSDDELLLKILIPGKSLKRSEPGKSEARPVSKAPGSVSPFIEFPKEFTVDVDGEIFNVKISPVGDGSGNIEVAADPGQTQKTTGSLKEIPSGAVLCGMPGLVLSVEVKVGSQVNEGDLLAVVEAMKMRRQVNSPRSGVVKEIWIHEGKMVNPEDVLMVVE